MDCIHALKCSFDVIAITETWMDQPSSVQENTIRGYNTFNAFRTYKRGGGVAVYIKNNYESLLVKHKTVAIDGILECVTIEINLKNKAIN